MIVEEYILGELKTLISENSVKIEKMNVLMYPVEMLNILNHGSAPPDHLLRFKKRCVLMVFRNQNL